MATGCKFLSLTDGSVLLSMGEEYVLPSSNSSKPYQYLVEVIGLDHCYSKPWSSQLRVPNTKPVKTLFLRDLQNESEQNRRNERKQKSEEDEFIDVDTVDDGNFCGPNVINMQYDVMKSKIAMGECEKYVSSVSSRRTPDTWEELICRTGWTNQQNVLFDKILKVVSSYRLAQLTYEGSPNEPILRRVALDKATKRARQILGRIEWDLKLTTWLHSSMVDGLSIPLLAGYLDILQTLRSKVPTLVDQMVATPTSHRRVSATTADNMTSLLKRPWDATIGLSSFQRQRKVSGPPLLLIVPSGPTTNSTGNTTKRSRFWHHHLSNLGKVIPVTMHLSSSGRGVSIGQCLDHMIGAVQAKVLELKNHFPNRPVVLIGWSTGALVSFQVSLVEPVCAVVCLGFPLLGLEGMRGEADDPFLESKTPTMFVVGSLSSCCSLPDIEEFRKKLVADTSLLLIGGADDQLRLTCSKKKIEGVTQSMVDRRIMDEIGEFLSNAVSVMNSAQNRSDYFDFDDIENRRKKPKTEKRKRPSTNATGGEAAKKPRTKVAKAVTQRGQGNATKKTKTVKNVKRPAANKPIVLPPGTTLVPGTSSACPTGSRPLPKLQSTPPTITGGILQGVAVPLSGVSGPVSGVNVPVSGVKVPISGVNVPISAVNISMPGVSATVSGVSGPISGVNVPVSAVIKPGSLGGRPFVFSCAQPTDTSASTTGPVTSSGALTSGGAGGTQHLKIVMNPSSGTTAVSAQQNMPLITSPVQQTTLQYRKGLVTNPKPAQTPTSTTVKTVAPAGPVSSTITSTVKISGSTAQIVVTSPATTSAAITSPGTTLNTGSQKQIAGNSPLVTQRLSGSNGAASVSGPAISKAAVPSSGQAQFIMRKGLLSAISKPGTVRPSAPSTIYTSQMKPVPVPQVQRPATSNNNRPQQIITTNSSVKQSIVRVDHAGSPHGVATPKKVPPSQTVTRTIQVGVKDPKKPMITKRTVTYSPSTLPKGVSVVSRPGPSPNIGALATRTSTPGSNVHTSSRPSTTLYSGKNSGALQQNIQDPGKKPTSPAQTVTQPANSQTKTVHHLIKQSMTTPALGVQSKNVLHRSSALVSASLASMRSTSLSTSNASLLDTQKPNLQSVSALPKSAIQPAKSPSLETISSQDARSIARYHDDQKLVEKIRGIVKDVVNSTPRSVKPGARQHIVISTKSTTPAQLGGTVTTVTTATGAVSQDKNVSSKGEKSTDETIKK